MNAKWSFKERLIELRTERGLTQRQLAKEISIHHAVIGNWETGKYSPNIEAVAVIAKFFEVSTDYLLGLKDDW